MLVLSRKQNQEILIGDEIKITVLQVKGNSIRLGIEAPPHVRVLRGEIADRRPSKMANVTVVYTDTVQRPVADATGRGSQAGRLRVISEPMPATVNLPREPQAKTQGGEPSANRIQQILSQLQPK